MKKLIVPNFESEAEEAKWWDLTGILLVELRGQYTQPLHEMR